MLLKLRQKVKNPVAVVTKKPQQVVVQQSQAKFALKSSVLDFTGWWAY